MNTSKIKGICTMAAAIALLAQASAYAAAPQSERYIVSFLDEAKGRSALRAAGASVALDLPSQGAAAAYIPSFALKGLRKNPNIEYIEVDAVRYPMSETTPWGIPSVQADLLTDVGTVNTKVCIIDSGYSNNHEDLPVLTIAEATADAGTGDPLAASTICHHGTHVAGTIAAVANNDVGVVGVNPGGDIALHIVKVFEDDPTSSSGCGWGYSSNLVAALDACQAAGSKIVNLSLGGSVKNRTEQRAFNGAYNDGVLSIAAAGNAGNTRHSYPASYDSVVSVAAVDSSFVVADFSQQTSQVELAAPGVVVRSTVTMGTGLEESLAVGTSFYEATGMDGSPDASATGNLFRCEAVDGLGSPGDCAGATGQVCLISRGDITFAEKVAECDVQGGVGAVIFNNAGALFTGTLGGAGSIPAVGVSGVDGADLVNMTGQSATVATAHGGHYAFYDGTSMATPHVAGVAALVWSQNENHVDCSNEDIRTALAASALDLGDAGRDNAYGYGLVQAFAAVDALDCSGGGGGEQCPLQPAGASCEMDSECCSDSCKGRPGRKTCK